MDAGAPALGPQARVPPHAAAEACTAIQVERIDVREAGQVANRLTEHGGGLPVDNPGHAPFADKDVSDPEVPMHGGLGNAVLSQARMYFRKALERAVQRFVRKAAPQPAPPAAVH